MPKRHLLALALLASALYAANLGDGFVGDDFDLIRSIEGQPPGYFAALLWSNESGDVWADYGLAPERGRGYLRPLKIWLLAADRAVFGLRPAGFHLTATALFAASVLLAALLAARALPARPRLAAAGAAAAAMHPVFSEVVPWVTAREETLSLALGLAAILALTRHRDAGAPVWPFHAALMLALLAKESSIHFVALGLAFDLAHGRLAAWRPQRRAGLLRVWGPVALGLAAYLGLRWIAFGNLLGGSGGGLHLLGAETLRYHRHFFASLGDPTLLSLGAWRAGPWLAAALLAAPAIAVAAAWRRIAPRRRRDLLFFGPLWYLASTALYAGIGFVTRRHALPVLGLALFTAVALGALLEAGVLRRGRLWAAALLAAAAALFLPETLRTSAEFREASRRVAQLRHEIEQRAADLPDGSLVLVPQAPQMIVPPYYFGWGFQSALRRPFSASDLATRLEIVNPRNRNLNQLRTPLPEAFDRVVDLGPQALPPDWVMLRHDQRIRRDLGWAPVLRRDVNPW